MFKQFLMVSVALPFVFGPAQAMFSEDEDVAACPTSHTVVQPAEEPRPPQQAQGNAASKPVAVVQPTQQMPAPARTQEKRVISDDEWKAEIMKDRALSDDMKRLLKTHGVQELGSMSYFFKGSDHADFINIASKARKNLESAQKMQPCSLPAVSPAHKGKQVKVTIIKNALWGEALPSAPAPAVTIAPREVDEIFKHTAADEQEDDTRYAIGGAKAVNTPVQSDSEKEADVKPPAAAIGVFSDPSDVMDDMLRAQPDISQYKFIQKSESVDISNFVSAHGDETTLKKNTLFMKKLEEYTLFGDKVSFFETLATRAVDASRGSKSAEDSLGTPTIDRNVRTQNQKKVAELNTRYETLYADLQELANSLKSDDLPGGVFVNAAESLVKYWREGDKRIQGDYRAQVQVFLTVPECRGTLFLPDEIPTDELATKRARAVVKTINALDDTDLD